MDDSGSVPLPDSVKINEVLAHSDTEIYDWIELHNTTGSTINIGGWYLSDNDTDEASLKKYEIP
ncbi:MAG: lamin tail domain-containing protein, partial [Deltaproteobacteria bacterium]